MAVTPVDVGGSLAKGLQINALKQKMEAQKQQQQERNAMRSLYAERFGGHDPKTDITWDTGRQGPGKMTDEQFSGRMAAISPAAAMDWQKFQMSQNEATRARQAAEAPLFAAALEGVQDQGGYEQARQFLTQHGVDVSDMPDRYDPSTTNMALQYARYLGDIEGPEQAKPTPGMREYEMAVEQGYPGSFMEFQRDLKEAGSTRVSFSTGPTGIDYGKPEPGLVWARNADGSVRLDERGAPIGVPYQGGSVYREQQEGAAERQAAEEAAAKGQRQKATTANIVVEDIGRVFDIMDTSALPVTGFGSWASAVPGTPPHDVARLLDTVKANIGFDKLQAMREASPTGGALGQVSENENRLLQSTLGNLEQSQSPEQFRRNLERVREVFLDIVHGVGERPAQAAPEGGGEMVNFTAMAPQELLSVDVDALNADQLNQLDAAMTAAGL